MNSAVYLQSWRRKKKIIGDRPLNRISISDDTLAMMVRENRGIELFQGDSIPKEWIGRLARNNDILELAERLEKKYKVQAISQGMDHVFFF